MVLRHTQADGELEALVAVDSGGTPRLPAVAAQDRFYYGAVALLQEIRADLGVEVSFVRCLAAEVGVCPRPAPNLTVVEYRSGTPFAPWRFVALEPLCNDRRIAPRIALHQAVEWIKSADPRRVPWSYLGWLAAVAEWLPTRLASLGVELRGDVRQERAWERSCVLSFETTHGRLYLKFVPEVFRHEPALSAYLARRMPGCAPLVLAAGVAPTLGHYLLMQAYRDTSLTTCASVEPWARTVARYARLQKDLAACKEALMQTALPVRELADVERRASALFADATLIQGYGCELTDAEVRSLHLLVPALSAAAVRLQRSALPRTIDHGDLWSGQVLLADDDIVFTDWSDAAWSHPFLGMPFFLDDAVEVLGVDTVYSTLRAVYLDVWAGTGESADLRQEFAAAELLGPLENALLYAERILPAMDLRWEMMPMLRHHLRFLLSVSQRLRLP